MTRPATWDLAIRWLELVGETDRFMSAGFLVECLATS